MSAFLAHDTVRTKDGGIIGTIERTHLTSAANTWELSDYPIVCWVDVPEHILIQFVASGGIPPRGYVFVVAADDSQGAFLASVDDLELVSRSFDIGDSVRRQDGAIAIVVDINDTYDLRQLFHSEESGLKHFSELKPEMPPHSISGISSGEMKAAEEVLEQDLVSYQNWLGMVKDLDSTVVILLEDNSVVAIKGSSNILMPISHAGNRLLHPADFYGFPGPLPTVPFGRHSAVVPVPNPKIGSLVVVSRSSFEHGRWLRGQFTPNKPTEGHVIAVVPTRIMVNWLSCNQFLHLVPQKMRRPSTTMQVYQNIHTFKRGDELRLLSGLRLIDFSQPAELPVTGSEAGSWPKSKSLNALHIALNVGDCVKFRDPANAMIKYPAGGMKGLGFQPIDTMLTDGWDMNVFTITSKRQTVKVRWYDGSESTTSSNELSKFGSFEDDVRPFDIVVDRAGLKMKIISNRQQKPPPLRIDDTFVDFNEMTFFETPCDLIPQRVGVIQAVDAHDRVATVRWYKSPHVMLIDGGANLIEDSYFGPIGENIEECSMYEIMKFPGLSRFYRDLVIIPPQALLRVAEDAQFRRSVLPEIRRMVGEGTLADGPATILHLLQSPQLHGNFKELVLKDPTSLDWIGEIVALGLDGSITVRLFGASQCRDVTIDCDLVFGTLHIEDLLGSEDDEDSYYDTDTDDSESIVIAESIEYEGGERLDNDPTDENWESVDEEGADVDGTGEEDNKDGYTAGQQDFDNGGGDVEMTTEDIHVDEKPVEVSEPAPAILSPTPKPGIPPTPSDNKSSFCHVLSYLPSERPPSFAILDIQPPPDQYQLFTVVKVPPVSAPAPATSSTFLKRIQQEHRILSTSLPPTIFVRTYEANLKLFRCLIIGPPDTPYENAPFLIDLALPPNYPNSPPKAHFHSWTKGLGRINPNLYEEGKICLSLLGTWPGKESEESWSASATLLQLLVSIQGLIMVKKPFFNEAGFEEYANKTNTGYEIQSNQYNEKAYAMARRFVTHATIHPPQTVEDIVAWLYFEPPNSSSPGSSSSCTGLFQEALNRARAVIQASKKAREDQTSSSSGHANNNNNSSSSSNSNNNHVEEGEQFLDGAGHISSTEGFLKPLSRGAIAMITRLINELTDYLSVTRREIGDANSVVTTDAATGTTEREEEEGGEEDGKQQQEQHRLLVRKALDSIKG